MPNKVFPIKSISPSQATSGARLDPEVARQTLFDITKNLQGRKGGLRIIHSSDGGLQFDLAKWSWNRRRDSKEQFDNARDLAVKLLKDSYQPVIDRMEDGQSKVDKQQKLNSLVSEIQQTIKDKRGVFGQGTMRKFFNKAEQLFTLDTEQNKVASKPKANTNENFKPRLKIFPPFEVKTDHDLKSLVETVTGREYDDATANKLGSGAFGQVYKFQTPYQETKALKIHNQWPLISNDLRNYDGVNLFLASKKGAPIPGLIRATSLFIRAERKGTGIPSFYHIPLSDPRAAKEKIRELQQNHKVAVAAQLMPVAQGKDLTGIDFKDKPENRNAVAKDLMKTLQACQNRGLIIHDIKPENIIHDEYTKITHGIDLGLATKLSKERFNTDGTPRREFEKQMEGTPNYFHPILFISPQHGPEVDAFSLAMTLGEIKWGGAFTDACAMRYDNPTWPKNLDPSYIDYRNNPSNKDVSELRRLLNHAQNRTKNSYPIVNDVLANLDAGDPEAQFIEKLMEISFTKPNFNGNGHKEIFADFYSKFEELLKDEYLTSQV